MAIETIPPVPTHATIVCGWDKNKNLVYMHTFDYQNDEEEKQLAIAAFKWCVDNCPGGFMIGDIDTIEIKEEGNG